MAWYDSINWGDAAVSAGSSLFDYFTADKVAEANAKASADNIKAQGANQERALNALPSEDEFKITTRDGTGGFKSTQPGGLAAADARGQQAAGDASFRVPAQNAASRDFSFKLPTISDAQGLVDRDIGRNQEQYDFDTNQLVSLLGRKDMSRDNSSGFAPMALDALSRSAKGRQVNRERDALSLFDSSAANDTSQLLRQIQANSPLAPAPGFTTGGPGATAANAIAQSPPPSQPADLSGALPFAAGGSLFSGYQAQERADTQNKQFLAAIRSLGNQGGGFSGGSNTGLINTQVGNV